MPRYWLMIAVVLLGAGCDRDRIARLEKQNQELHAQLKKQQADLQLAVDLDLQSKCAKQASEQFKAGGWGKDPLDNFESHYSRKLNKCFMLVRTTDFKTAPGFIFLNSGTL